MLLDNTNAFRSFRRRGAEALEKLNYLNIEEVLRLLNQEVRLTSEITYNLSEQVYIALADLLDGKEQMEEQNESWSYVLKYLLDRNEKLRLGSTLESTEATNQSFLTNLTPTDFLDATFGAIHGGSSVKPRNSPAGFNAGESRRNRSCLSGSPTDQSSNGSRTSDSSASAPLYSQKKLRTRPRQHIHRLPSQLDAFEGKGYNSRNQDNKVKTVK